MQKGDEEAVLSSALSFLKCSHGAANSSGLVELAVT